VGLTKNDISLTFLQNILNLYKSSDNNSFKDALSKAFYSNLTSKEREVLNYLRENPDSLKNVQIVLQEVQEETQLYAKRKDYTQEYLNELKMLEEIDFKIRELKKYYRKMEKISGILPINELIEDIKGTSLKLSNFHITNLEKLNYYNFNSPLFN
jgi:predicted MPP superfamily phosphohydrolase